MTPFTDRTGRFSALKTATLAGLMLPALWIGWRYGAGDLAPLPVKEALHLTGLWSLRLLVICLALTPAQRFLAWPKLALVRRMVGLGAAAYAGAHLSLYVVMQHFDLAQVASEILSRRYLQIGLLALLGLAALASTSTDAALRRLGARWKTLHKAVYAITGLGLLHFFMQAKIDVSAAVLLAGLFILLMTYRLVLARRPVSASRALVFAGLAAAAATLTLECAWYGLASGISPWRVAAANLHIVHGPRPAVLVLATGLAAALAVWVRAASKTGTMKRIWTCLNRRSVLDRRPASARSSAG